MEDMSSFSTTPQTPPESAGNKEKEKAKTSRSLSAPELSAFCGQIALVLKSGISAYEGITIMRNVPLAHALYEQGTENAYIPKDLIGPVAEVLRWVQSLQNQ